MTFYYHFQDIYDLVEWSCEEDARRALAGNRTAGTWQTGLLNIFVAVRENKPFIMNVYRCVSRERVERFLFPVTRDLIMGVVDERLDAAQDLRVRDADREFLADFFTYAFVGVMLDWVRDDMRADPAPVVERIATAMDGQMDLLLARFAAR